MPFASSAQFAANPVLDIIPQHTTMKIIARAMLFLAVVAFCCIGLQAQDHPGQYDRADIETGSRLYATQCIACHGPNGDMINGIDLRRGLFKTAVSDEDLTRVLTTGRPDAGMPAFGLLQPREMTGLVAFIRAGFDASASVKLGDASRGQALFSAKGGCASCHRVNGRGPRVASDLSEIGAIRTPASLQRTLLEPARITDSRQSQRGRANARWQTDPRTTTQRRHLYDPAYRRRRTPGVFDEIGSALASDRCYHNNAVI